MSDGQTLVIIVDDDQAVRESLQFALRLEGFCVHTHNGITSLLADPDLGRADCMILDHRMPRLDGFDLLSTIRTRNPDVPAIMLTSRTTSQDRVRATAAGVHSMLEKPLLDDVLMHNIRAVLGVPA